MADQRCRRESSFVALKILTANASHGCFTGQMDEQSFHERIFTAMEPPHRRNASTASNSTPMKRHPGIAHISLFFGSLPVQSTHGDHVCFVFEVLGPNIANLRKAFGTPGLALPVVKAITKQSLLALDYLHDICGIIHCGKHVLIDLQFLLTNLYDTDVKPENILLKISMDSISSKLATTSALNTAGQPTSQVLPVTGLALDGLQVKIADFGHGDCP